MYTDEDLDDAIEEGIFTETSVTAFRSYISESNSLPVADEENIRLVMSFHDVFVVIACLLLLISSAWVATSVHPALAMVVVSMLSWGLSELFARKRKMALPAIVLLMTFVGSIFACFMVLFDSTPERMFVLSAAAASIGAWLHWKRFQVPITVAAGAAFVVMFVVSLFMIIYPNLFDYTLYLIFLSGIITFCIAMIWDSADISRITRKSDVAFWLHLVSAPLIVHPIFSNLGVLKGDDSLISVVTIMGLYAVLTIISLIVDRRAFMVSSLVYVLFALTVLLGTYGLAGDSIAFVGVFIGFSLLMLSGFWHKARCQLVNYLPKTIQNKVPLAV